ncbi:cerato-platanin-like secreted protein, partial [Zopfochytrium polystomum]
MKADLLFILLSVALAATGALGFPEPRKNKKERVDVAFNPTYDTANMSTNSVACSNGETGLATKGFATLGDLPSFPNVSAVAGASWNSTTCGKCFKVWHGNVSVNVIAVDLASSGFILSKTAMDLLTGGQAEKLGKIEAFSVETTATACGLVL